MAISTRTEERHGASRDHGFHPLRVQRVVRETADSVSVVFDVPPELSEAFAYRAGQFMTFRLQIDGETILRSYSMSSSPEVGDELQVTVKAVPGGIVSNWFKDTLVEGDVLETTRPAGVFCLGTGAGEVVTFAGGSGITPVFSVIKTALATTSRRVRLLYANRDREATIFAAELDRLAAEYGDRLDVVHHLDSTSGFLDSPAIEPYTTLPPDAEYFICGPGPFMDLVEDALHAHGVQEERIHIERFTPREPVEVQEAPTPAAGTGATQVTVELDGRTETTEHRPGTTILQTARQMGLMPPYSCEAGDCATCMARIVEGAATMYVNNALLDDEVADGWVLTCQAVPTTPTVRVVYGYE